MEAVRGKRGGGVGVGARMWNYARAFCLLACVSASAFAQPSQRFTTYEYHDNTQSWRLGQVQRITANSIESERTSFNAQALPEQRFVFGERVSTTTYHRDGNVASVTDGGGQVTRFEDYQR
ncbi:MAG TPA: hypothetical protein VM469_05120, partial [Pseudoxanthomonas sp.]|nr:hypothetical protein [Pseudoxanthomonas sp.]